MQAPVRYRDANFFVRAVRRSASLPVFSFVYAHLLHRLDGVAFALTGGRRTLSGLVAGWPVVMLTTIGAKSGQRRTTPVIGFPDGERLVLVATNHGKRQHANWYLNLRAHPEAEIIVGGERRDVIAHEVEGEERDRLWRMALEVYPVLPTYERWARGRRMPVVALSPRGTDMSPLTSDR